VIIARVARISTWSVLFALVTLGTGSSSATADDHCRLQLGRGWAQGAGKGAMVIKNNGKACGASLYTVPEANVAVEAIKVDLPPKNGTLKIEVPKFLYTPRSGFTGRDRFELSAEGPDRVRGQRITLKGEVAVQVDP
jgi:hypothetical protein